MFPFNTRIMEYNYDLLKLVGKNNFKQLYNNDDFNFCLMLKDYFFSNKNMFESN